MPPLYRLTQGGKTIYARDDADRERLLKSEFRANAKVEVSRFKGLGEMMPAATEGNHHAAGPPHPDPGGDRRRRREDTEDLVERLMGKKPELRFQFIQENAAFATGVDI